MEGRYPFEEIEPRIQAEWSRAGAFRAVEKGEKFYCLSMFPYPSGRLHMGHVRNYAIGDAVARYWRMRGKNVLQPIGWDAFGLPAENAAIEKNIHPAKWTWDNIGEMRAQLKRLGFAIDWPREIATCRPRYYRWQQRFIARLFAQGLVYKKTAPVNWDPVDLTVLANEQVIEGRGWRSGAPVERREISMYFMKITAYAEELLRELDAMDWPESVKTMQRNWIGKSKGARVYLQVDRRREVVECFSTRPDTLFGATFCALSPEHPLTKTLAQSDSKLAAFAAECARQGSEAAIETAEKRGYDTGLKVVHPFDPARRLPLFVANFVLAQYGSGAIYGCPAHDQRDLEFARKYDLPVVPVVLPPGENAATAAIADRAYDGDGTMINSGFLNGLSCADAKNKAIEKLEEIRGGDGEVQYRLRDWGISRQRYWGCPIPIIHCPSCGDLPAPEEELPITLPEDVTLDGRGSPLSKLDSFINRKCPKCGQAAKRETDTMDTFVDSSWYFARFACPDADSEMVDARAAYWMPVDQYIGGIEHAILHLLYARFFHKLMRDAGMYPQGARYDEPFARLICQGMVLADSYYRTDPSGRRVWIQPARAEIKRDGDGRIVGAKERDGGAELVHAGMHAMSKSKNNGVDPEALIQQYGADAARLFTLFAAPPRQSLEWSDDGVKGCVRFLNRLWNLAADLKPRGDDSAAAAAEDKNARRTLHQILAKAGYDMARYRLNNIASAAMKIANLLEARAAGGGSESFLREGFSILLRLLAPLAPHIAQELWARLDFGGMIIDAPWPEADEAALIEEEIKLVVQVNGKRRGEITVPAAAAEQEIIAAARNLPAAARHLQEREIKKAVVVAGKIVNLVVT